MKKKFFNAKIYRNNSATEFIVENGKISEIGTNLPSCDDEIDLQGRMDNYPKRRGLNRVKELLEDGINICFAQDSINDPWYPLGNGNMMNILDNGIHYYTVDRKKNRGNLIWQFSLLNVTNNKNPFSVYKKDDKFKAFVLIPIMPSVSVRRVF